MSWRHLSSYRWFALLHFATNWTTLYNWWRCYLVGQEVQLFQCYATWVQGFIIRGHVLLWTRIVKRYLHFGWQKTSWHRCMFIAGKFHYFCVDRHKYVCYNNDLLLHYGRRMLCTCNDMYILYCITVRNPVHLKIAEWWNIYIVRP